MTTVDRRPTTALVLVLVVVARIVGILLGVKARGIGERRPGTAGVVMNAAVAAFLLLSSLLQLALA